MTHQEIVEASIRILENVKNNKIAEAKKQIEKLTPIEVVKLFSIGQSGYQSELQKLKDWAIYW